MSLSPSMTDIERINNFSKCTWISFIQVDGCSVWGTVLVPSLQLYCVLGVGRGRQKCLALLRDYNQILPEHFSSPYSSPKRTSFPDEHSHQCADFRHCHPRNFKHFLFCMFSNPSAQKLAQQFSPEWHPEPSFQLKVICLHFLFGVAFLVCEIWFH